MMQIPLRRVAAVALVFLATVVTYTTRGFGAGAAQQAPAHSGGVQAPRFEVDPFWPKPLPNHWALGAARVRDAALGTVPVPVSPGNADAVALVEARCPTFSWGGTDGAAAYDLLVVPAGTEAEAGEEIHGALRARVPGSALSYTPALGSCLERGSSYAWLVRALDRGGKAGEWSEARAIEVAAGPPVIEVESALETLRAYLAERAATGEPRRDPQEPQDHAVDRRQGAGRTVARDIARDARFRQPAPRPPIGEIGVPERIASAAAPDPAGPVSVSVAQHVELAPSSALVRDGELLLWTDGTNTALGGEALKSNTIGFFNTALGRRALANNFDGRANVAVGYGALYSNDSGVGNVAVGDSAMSENEYGGANVAVGPSALLLNIGGNYNTAVGRYALAASTASYGTAVGARALRSNTTGVRNTAVGDDALYENRTHSDNTAVGSQALRASNGGYSNSAVGAEALLSNTIGRENTAVGADALRSNDSGSFNTAVGEDALFSNETGVRNTAVGNDALDSATGSDNVALGDDAGQAIGTGSFNIMIGSDGQSGDANTIRIGNPTNHDATFIAGIEDVQVAGDQVTILGTGQLGVAPPSSRRFKHEVRELTSETEALLRLRPVRFRYRPELVAGAEGVEFGLLAEEVAEVLPELVRLDEEGRPFSVRYQLLTPLLLSELQRQERTIRELRARLARLERRGGRRVAPG